MPPESQGQKLWFWRRMLASAIDGLLASLFVTLIVAAIFGTSGDHVRLGSFGIQSTGCEKTEPSEAVRAEAARMVPGIVWTHTILCTTVGFGLLENRNVVLSRAEPFRGGALTRTATVPVDKRGEPVSPFHVDWIGGLVFLAAVIGCLASRFQATPGLYVMGLRLAKEDGGRPSLRTVVLRELSLILPVIPAFAMLYGAFMLVFNFGLGLWVLFLSPILFVVIFGLWWRPFAILPGWPRAPVHDVLTRTRMVRRTG